MIKPKKYHTKQQSDNDCGIACLISVYNYLGNKNINSDYLKDFVMKTDDYSIKDLISITKKIDEFDSRAVKINNDDLTEVIASNDFPLIALTYPNDRGHYIVIYESIKDNLIISDPSKNTISKIKTSEFIKIFSGVLLVISKKESYIEPIANKELYISKKKYLLEILKNNIGSLVLTFIFSILVIVLTLASSLFIMYIVDTILPNNFESLLVSFSILFLVINFLNVLFDYLRNIIIINMSLKLDLSITKDFFEKLTKLPLSFFEKRDGGDIISRFNDSAYIRNIFSTTLITSVLDSFIIIGMGVFLYSINPILFLTTILPLLILLILSILFIDPIREKNIEVLRKASKTNSFLIQFISNMNTIFSFNKKHYFLKEFEKQFNDQIISTNKEHKIVNTSNSLKNLIQTSFLIIILWVGSQQVLNDSITLGTLLLVNTIVAFMLNSLDSLISVQSEIQKAAVAVDRVFNIINYPNKSKFNRINYTDKIHDIRIENLSFSYDGFHNVFSELNFNVKLNEKILIKGSSGNGKSTLAKIISNLYESPPNSVLINGIDINTYKHKFIKDKIIYQDSDPFFFSGTLLENLLMGKKIELSEIIEACIAARIFDFIESKDDGFNFHIVEHGSNLSTGQKQRLAFARILIHKPEVIILDESLSNIDKDNLKEIHKFLDELNCILIYISHSRIDDIAFSEIIDFDKKYMQLI